ncbi:pyruvate decarboxylase THI3 [Macrolepiota fuliginosa MF-IS2]|uniref:Pyruvate decarboxylase THI3 n=1 Tax=Macrolepiota fuliginosa MF-IS2 TaxID=1400762 RepID=A0A9P6CA85_9AGAR|nr:pyruvate decarboxylase THI3 [Macrolepiota fuliginosa MF-IS2]
MPIKQAVDALQGEVARLKLELQSLQATQGVGNITVGNYLLARLAQLGVTKMFGLPGDFNLGFLDLVEDHPTIDWVGNCNELNAAYAADGYARVKQNSLGVVTTTFGVGELSAMNGIAGAFSEMVPVLHLVGAPSTSQHKTRPILHHTLGDGRYDAYTIASKQFTILQTALVNKHEVAHQIDEALTVCITKARPVYMTLPTDMVHQEISGERLKIPLTRQAAINDPQTEEFVLDLIHERVKEVGGDVVILVDACVIRFDVQDEVNEFLKQTGFPVYSTPMGKSCVNESYKRYGGIYIGTITHPLAKERVENAKLIISVGSLQSDFNTGNFSYNIPIRRHIELHSDHTKVQYALFKDIGMKHLLPKLTERLQHFYPIASKLPVAPFTDLVPTSQENDQTIVHAYFWPRVGQFFHPKDVIVTETGTANFGILDVPLPDGTKLISQVLWGSIGWSVGSALGAAFAAREVGKDRVILFVGEGSLQLTVQEISPMIRYGLKPIIFVINNSGYTIERYIHGKHRKYNNVDNWKWTSLLDTFGGNMEQPYESYSVKTRAELDTLLDQSSFAAANKIQLVEVIMPALDAPLALERQAEMTGKGNQYATVI